MIPALLDNLTAGFNVLWCLSLYLLLKIGIIPLQRDGGGGTRDVPSWYSFQASVPPLCFGRYIVQLEPMVSSSFGILTSSPVRAV